MRVYIAGCNGGMGRRYTAVLRHLGHVPTGFDIPGFHEGHELADKVRIEAESSDAVIIASPTETHISLLDFFAETDRPILCEKPISKNIAEIKRVMARLVRTRTKLRMVSQYDYIVDPDFDGPTLYDYFKSGPDGLYWDCINVVKHAKGKVTLRNESPVWNCWINGQKLNLGLMDQAYVEMMKDWLSRPEKINYDAIIHAHEKVARLEAKCLMS